MVTEVVKEGKKCSSLLKMSLSLSENKETHRIHQLSLSGQVVHEECAVTKHRTSLGGCLPHLEEIEDVHFQ